MKNIGDIGEILAIKYLQKNGYSICDTNFKFGRFGEIDVIAKKDGKVHFIEVKYRSNLAYGYPEESIVPKKLHKCLKTIEYYCVTHCINMQETQFDVISILKKTHSYQVVHYKNIEI